MNENVSCLRSYPVLNSLSLTHEFGLSRNMLYTVGRELFVIIQTVRQFLVYGVYQRVGRFPEGIPALT